MVRLPAGQANQGPCPPLRSSLLYSITSEREIELRIHYLFLLPHLRFLLLYPLIYQALLRAVRPKYLKIREFKK